MKTKILFFHPYFRDGGVERTNIRLAAEFIRQGHEVKMIALSFSSHFQKDLENLGIKKIELGHQRLLLSVFSLLKVLWQEKANPVILISCQNYVNLFCVLLKVFMPAGMKLVLCERNHPSELDIRGGRKNWFIKEAIARLYRFSDAVIANSQETAEALRLLCSVPTLDIYNPTIDQHLVDFKQTSRSPRDLQKLVFVGRLDFQKNPETLLKAFAFLLNDYPSLKLHFIGDGPLTHSLKSLRKDLDIQEESVIFSGFQEEAFKEIATSGLLILPSRYEGLPNVLIEALYLNTPVIAADCSSGPKEILNNGEFGQLFPVGDVQALYRCMKTFYANEKMKPLASEAWLKQFHSAYSAEQYLKVFRNL